MKGFTMESRWGRLYRVARTDRRLKRGAGVLLVGLAAVGLIGQTQPAGAPTVHKVVEAEKFILRDVTGAARIELTVLTDGSPTLGFLDGHGRPRALLGLTPDGSPALALLDRDEKARLTLSVRADGVPAVTLSDRDGRLRARLELAVDGLPGLTFFDRDGRARAALGVMGDGQLFVFPGGR